MRLRPTDKNAIFGKMLSALAWAQIAVSSDKVAGPRGFEEFCSGEWMHYIHYKQIHTDHPEYSSKSALPEMSTMRDRLIVDIVTAAQSLDEMLMRLQRMEEQMKEVSDAL